MTTKYIRLLPNCLLEQNKLIEQHQRLDEVLAQVNDSRFFHQYKVHGAPKTGTCHQSYFRPYLSEVGGGTVYPCDSVVLNEAVAKFDSKWALCKVENILDYLNHEFAHKFDPRKDCSGCVFTDNVNMLDDWVNHRIDRFDEFPDPLVHEEFV